MKEAGYLLDTNIVLRDVKEEEKEDMLCGHSEKLAVAFGLINACPGSPIRVIKIFVYVPIAMVLLIT